MLVRRETRTGSNDLNVLYRPLKISEMLGQESICKMVGKWLCEDTTPHTILFTGDPGCGKTTMARIISLGLNCERLYGASKTHEEMKKEARELINEKFSKGAGRVSGVIDSEFVTANNPCLKCNSCLSIINQNSIDVFEVNVGRSGTKGDVEAIVKDLPSAPFSSRYKIVVFDEAHELTSASQNLLLKIMEDGFKHVYLFFCTNEPHKLKPAFSGGRVTRLHFDRISTELLYQMLENIAQFEGMTYNKKVLLYLAEEAKGVPRDCLPWLKQVADEGSWSLEVAKQITGVLIDEDDPQVIELCKTLLYGDWKKSVKLYDDIKLPAEKIRLAVAGFMAWKLKTSKTIGQGRMYSDMLEFLTNPIYMSGKAGDHVMYNYMFKTIQIIKMVRRS